MKLLTEEIKSQLPPFGAGFGDTVHRKDRPIICCFFTPAGMRWHWFVTEGEQQEDGDWMFYGLVHGYEKEWGYFRLSELTSADCGFGLGVERDLYFSPKTIGDLSEHPMYCD